MTSREPNNASAALAREEIRRSAAAMVDHLKRLGLEMLPIHDPRNVERLTGVWVSQEEPLAAASDVVAKTTGPSPSTATRTESVSNKSKTLLGTAPSSSLAQPSSQRTGGRLTTVDAFHAAEGEYPGTNLSAAERETLLNKLADEVDECTKCDTLAATRNRTVFGEGSITPRFVFLGEAPGADEDRSGRPFVGRAGQLLTKMISACNIDREDCFILNTIKCRPPGNRNPEPGELSSCRGYYQQQLSILRPEYVVCLGAVSAKELLSSTLSVGRLRGKLHSYYSSKVLVTYHPAYLLRNPDAKKAAWQDLQLMMADAGLSPA
ncbi:MAG: uracil-DNA glycosylase [Planctomycetota bacterium]